MRHFSQSALLTDLHEITMLQAYHREPQRPAPSENTASVIEAEIERLLKDAHGRVRETLEHKRTLLNALAQALLQKETADRSDLDALLKQDRNKGERRIHAKYRCVRISGSDC